MKLTLKCLCKTDQLDMIHSVVINKLVELLVVSFENRLNKYLYFWNQ